MPRSRDLFAPCSERAVATTDENSDGDNTEPARQTARRIDHLGRVVIPVEMRRALNLEPGDALDLRLDDHQLWLARFEESCVICGRDHDLHAIRDILVCRDCMREIAQHLGREADGP